MTTTYDVGLENGDLPARTYHITGAELVRQRLEIRLGTWLGEWLLDQRVGLRVLEWLQQRPVRVEEIGGEIRREIETCPGVLQVDEWSGALSSAGVLAFSGRITVDDGTVLSLVVEPPTGVPGNSSSGAVVRISQVPILRGLTR